MERRQKIILGNKTEEPKQQRLEQRILRKLAKQTVSPSGKISVGVREMEEQILPKHMLPSDLSYQKILQSQSRKEQAMTPNRRKYIKQIELLPLLFPLFSNARRYTQKLLEKNSKPVDTHLLYLMLYNNNFKNNMKRVYQSAENIVLFLLQQTGYFYFGFRYEKNIFIVQYQQPIQESLFLVDLPMPPIEIETTTSEEWRNNPAIIQFLKKLERVMIYKIPPQV